jgi:L-alanine-DL-glutamate epimerase-like enolase superfamily enzyme
LRSPLRRELLVEDLRGGDGQLDLPTKPGLGIELNRDALRKYRASNLG